MGPGPAEQGKHQPLHTGSLAGGITLLNLPLFEHKSCVATYLQITLFHSSTHVVPSESRSRCISCYVHYPHYRVELVTTNTSLLWMCIHNCTILQDAHGYPLRLPFPCSGDHTGENLVLHSVQHHRNDQQHSRMLSSTVIKHLQRTTLLLHTCSLLLL